MTSLRARPVAVRVRAVLTEGAHGRLVRVVHANGMQAPCGGRAEDIRVLSRPALRTREEHQQLSPSAHRRRRVDGHVRRFARARGRGDAAVGGGRIDLALHRRGHRRRIHRQERRVAGGCAGPSSTPGHGSCSHCRRGSLAGWIACRRGRARGARPCRAAVRCSAATGSSTEPLPVAVTAEGGHRPCGHGGSGRLGSDGWSRHLGRRPASTTAAGRQRHERT